MQKTSARVAPFAHIKNQLLVLVLSVLTGLVAVVSWAQAADRDNVAAFLSITGFDVAIDSIALSATSAPDLLGMNQGDFGAQWTAVAEDVFDTELMQNRALNILEATLDDELLAHAASFYASDLGQRLVQVENDSHMADDDEKNLVGNAMLSDMQESEDPRIDLFRRMSVAIDPNDIGPQAMTEIQVRFILAASYAGVIDLRTDEDGLRALLNENAEEMADAIETSSLANAAYTYRDFSLEELVAYTEALEHPDMMTVYELMNAVHFEVMSNRFEALALRMGDIQPVQDL
ncbi:DUF2059 domain-containing protein [Shimia sagamensis]|uniref:DUF2059 domain-containing protein n=1 Tax=Shimia sagamensis TaxID=1566352 RepID=A0ABY1NHA9_9RHOB|nr:DUF2059 domain-containing protein [Shimia sagamensis]SMP09859.1 hypothetical protein SAMN06265373_10218 [Shimia sagamensis]